MCGKGRRRKKAVPSAVVAEEATGSGSEEGRILNLCELKRKSTGELLAIAEELGVVSNGRMLKQEIIFQLMKRVISEGGVAIGGGVVETLPDGFGFLRSAEANYAASSDDI
ncbi:MAG: Rho termination factor N-terminal domain-containing protein, partial [Anaplasma sp.]|nr:Rho termination factor N-terminal domain-containing protein [Anaplasma sp.]